MDFASRLLIWIIKVTKWILGVTKLVTKFLTRQVKPAWRAWLLSETKLGADLGPYPRWTPIRLFRVPSF